MLASLPFLGAAKSAPVFNSKFTPGQITGFMALKKRSHPLDRLHLLRGDYVRIPHWNQTPQTPLGVSHQNLGGGVVYLDPGGIRRIQSI
jgi:hypothetical protein